MKRPDSQQAAKEINYTSSADGSTQPAIFYAPTTQKGVPLVVALHTWSFDYKQDYHQSIEAWCIKNGWAYIHPNFRGPNNRPEATGSKLVVADIVDAVAYAKQVTHIDSSAIFLVGTSGGGYTALLMAGHYPEIWAGVSAWVPISDLKAWHEQGEYVSDLESSCGGPPGVNAKVDKEYVERSPITYLHRAKGINLDINAGIYDGHEEPVPISHSLVAFNKVAEVQDQISEEDIRYFTDEAKVPPKLQAELSDPTYGDKRPLFRRMSGSATVTIFEGGHELVASAAIGWIEQIHNSKNREIE